MLEGLDLENAAQRIGQRLKWIAGARAYSILVTNYGTLVFHRTPAPLVRFNWPTTTSWLFTVCQPFH